MPDGILLLRNGRIQRYDIGSKWCQSCSKNGIATQLIWMIDMCIIYSRLKAAKEPLEASPCNCTEAPASRLALECSGVLLGIVLCDCKGVISSFCFGAKMMHSLSCLSLGVSCQQKLACSSLSSLCTYAGTDTVSSCTRPP